MKIKAGIKAIVGLLVLTNHGQTIMAQGLQGYYSDPSETHHLYWLDRASGEAALLLLGPEGLCYSVVSYKSEADSLLHIRSVGILDSLAVEYKSWAGNNELQVYLPRLSAMINPHINDYESEVEIGSTKLHFKSPAFVVDLENISTPSQCKISFHLGGNFYSKILEVPRSPQRTVMARLSMPHLTDQQRCYVYPSVVELGTNYLRFSDFLDLHDAVDLIRREEGGELLKLVLNQFIAEDRGYCSFDKGIR